MLDFINITLGVVGLLVSIAGFIIAILQIQKTKGTAEAAKKAAEGARANVLYVLQLVSVEQMTNSATNLVRLVRDSDWHGSASEAFELRTSLAKLPKFGNIRKDPGDYKSSTLNEMVRAVHELLEKAAAVNKIGKEQKQKCLNLLGLIGELLSNLAGEIASKEQENGNS